LHQFGLAEARPEEVRPRPAARPVCLTLKVDTRVKPAYDDLVLFQTNLSVMAGLDPAIHLFAIRPQA
jgi:hypothetical protein